jgi:cytochrome c biogenesis protein CcmG, thiol:disulfide interchange protein DsbE
MKKFLFVLSISFAAFSILGAQKTIPTVTLKTLEGKPYSTDKITKNKKITVVSFWATWCSPCKKELEAMQGKYEDWKTNYDVEIVAITIDDSRQLAKVKPTVQQKGWKFLILSDVNKDLPRALNFQNIPQTYLLNEKGQIIYSHSGYNPGDENELEKKIKAAAGK